MTEVATGFSNLLSAKMAGQETEDYVSSREQWLEKFDELRDKANQLKIKTLTDYKQGMALKGMLSSLFCFACNNGKDNWEEVGDVEGIVGKKLFAFVKKQTTKDSTVKTVCRYLLWTKYYTHQNVVKIFDFLLQHNMLRKQNGSLLVIGLHGKTGDNVFSVDGRGRHHRTYVDHCGFQAMCLHNSRFQEYAKKHLGRIPELEEHYDGVSVQDGKYSVRPIRLKQREKNLITREFCN